MIIGRELFSWSNKGGWLQVFGGRSLTVILAPRVDWGSDSAVSKLNSPATPLDD